MAPVWVFIFLLNDFPQSFYLSLYGRAMYILIQAINSFIFNLQTFTKTICPLVGLWLQVVEGNDSVHILKKEHEMPPLPYKSVQSRPYSIWA